MCLRLPRAEAFNGTPRRALTSLLPAHMLQSAVDTLKQANPATRDMSEKHC